jgi:hypothetical protein
MSRGTALNQRSEFILGPRGDLALPRREPTAGFLRRGDVDRRRARGLFHDQLAPSAREDGRGANEAVIYSGRRRCAARREGAGSAYYYEGRPKADHVCGVLSRLVGGTMLGAEPRSSPALHQHHIVTEESPFAAVAGVHEGAAVIVDLACALALAVAEMAHKHHPRRRAPDK